MQAREFGIAEIIRNDEDRYDGNLAPYFRALFFHAQNLRHPYHNLRHMLHVTWLCYQASVFYDSRLTRREVRNLLIAALFHDFDHSGQFGNDDLNIERAIRGLKHHIQPEDIDHLRDIEVVIRASEFPHRDVQESLLVSILRDADVSQALTVAWIQQVIIGLATEWGKPPLEVLKSQKGFHRSLKLVTDWAASFFPARLIEAKIAEAEALLALLEVPTP